jgi:hypothetical protein
VRTPAPYDADRDRGRHTRLQLTERGPQLDDIEPGGIISTVPSPTGNTRLERRGQRWMFVKGRLKCVALTDQQNQLVVFSPNCLNGRAIART